MKYKILLYALIPVLVSSCHSTYRNTQTPDDVYYSPARPLGEEERKDESKREERYTQSERQIRMARYDRRWRDFDDDFNCHYDPYRYGYTYGYYYNPYYYPYPVYYNIPVRNPKNTTPRTTNLASYQYQNITVTNPKTGTPERSYRGRRYNNDNSNRETRETLTPSSGNNRSYSPSSSSGRSTGTPVSRPGKN